MGGVSAWLVVAALLAPSAGTAAGSRFPPAALPRLDARVAALAEAAPESAQSVWVELTDKGEVGPGELAAMLALARGNLTERALRRRVRAGVLPLVDYRDLPVHEPYVDALRRAGLVPYGASRWLNRVAVRADAGGLSALARQGFVRSISPVERVRVSRAPLPAALPAAVRGGAVDTSSYGVTFAQLDQIQLPALHDSGYSGAGVLICMLDDGYKGYRVHDALKDIDVPPGHVRNFIDGNTDVEDTTNAGQNAVHGAWTLGCVGGKKPGAYLGAAHGATFALARTEYDPTETPVEMVYWAQGAEWADSLGADIISSSLGYNTFDDPYPDYTYADMNGRTTTVTLAAIVAAQKGILVVTAAGNAGATPWRYVLAPGDVSGDSALTVGGVDALGAVPSFSSRGPTSDGRIKPDVVARAVATALPNVNGLPSSYTSASGTSFATPLVAGAAACLLQAHPAWTPVELSQAIRSTASRASTPDNDYGYGLVRALAAHAWPLGAPPPGPSPGVLEALGPNPFDSGGGGTAFGFKLVGPAETRLEIFDARGRRVRTLWRGAAWGGSPVVWDGRDDGARPVPAGVYWARLAGALISRSQKIVALR